MAIRTLHVGLLLALGALLAGGSLMAAWRMQGPAAEESDRDIGKGVQVKTLPAGDSAGRYEATVVARAKGTYSDYMVELMDRASRGCDGGFSVDESTFGPDVDARVPRGESLRVVVSCQHDRLPNHRIVATGDHALAALPEPQDALVKSASRLVNQHGGSKKRAAESLLGGFLREAYTEQCAGKAVLVQFIATATDPGTASVHLPEPESMAATMHYQCVEPDAIAAR